MELIEYITALTEEILQKTYGMSEKSVTNRCLGALIYKRGLVKMAILAARSPLCRNNAFIINF
jgi:hypothetical protein